MARDNYTAVTGDLVGSRKLAPAERSRLQAVTLEALGDLNARLASAHRDPRHAAVLTAGDEVQALFVHSLQVGDFIQVLTDRITAAGFGSPGIVFGVGHGPLSVELERVTAGVEQLDGPCFHRARAALDVAKRDRVWAVWRGFGESFEDQDVPDDAWRGQVLTSLYELMGAIRSGWTTTRAEYVVAVRGHEIPTFDERAPRARLEEPLEERGARVRVARERDVSPSVVTESLQNANFRALRNGELAAHRLLVEFEFPESEVDRGSR